MCAYALMDVPIALPFEMFYAACESKFEVTQVALEIVQMVSQIKKQSSDTFYNVTIVNHCDVIVRV